MNLYARSLLAQTLPRDARRILLNCFEYAGEDRENVAFIRNVESAMERFASEFCSPGGSWQPTDGFAYMLRAELFDSRLRGFLHAIGGRLDMSGFTPRPLEDPAFHQDLAGACKQAGFDLQHDFCDSVRIDASGRARADSGHIVRLRAGDMFMDAEASEDSFHVVRFIADNSKQAAFGKLRTFAAMVRLLHRTAPVLTAKAASVNDRSVFMAKGGEWRFKTEESVWGFSISRLERFWLRAGAVPERILGGDSRVLALFREDRALEFAKEFRREKPDSASPFFYASRQGIYKAETLALLRR